MKPYYLFLLLLIFSCSTNPSEKKDSTVNNKPNLVESSTLSTSKESPQTLATNKAAPNQMSRDASEVISASQPINFYFTPSIATATIKSEGNHLLKFLSTETGYTYNAVVPKNYDELINDFENGKAHVGIMNSLSYVIATKKAQIQAKLRVVRYGKATYFGQIIANKETGIEKVEDLHGRSFAYTDESSTSGYLFPKKMMSEKGVKPGTTTFAQKHDNVVRMVYKHEVDAGATFYSEPAADGTIRDARARLIEEYPDIEEKVKIISITEPIPNDPVVFSNKLPKDVIYKTSLALLKYANTEDGRMHLDKLYGTEGFVRCSDKDFDILRKALSAE